MMHLADLLNAQAGMKPSATVRSIDLLFKELYDRETAAGLSRWLEEAENPLYAFIKKDKSVPEDRFYVIPLEYTVPRAICPDCEELVEITPNGADPMKTNKRQRLVLHPDKRKPGTLCTGGGKDA